MAGTPLFPSSVSFRPRLMSPITRLLLFLQLITLIFTSNCRDYDPMLLHEKTLFFSNKSAFKIALFADLHYGENAWTDWGPAQDVNSDRVMSTVLDQETPDFVVYLGDVITANNLPIPNASLYWDRAISPTKSRGIPWATVFGNHDDAQFEWPSEWFSATGIPEVQCPQENISISGEECTFRGTTRVELMKKEISSNRLSYSMNGPRELWPGVSNYVLQLSSSKDPDSPAVFLYFLDSGGGSYPEVISSAQAKWFQKQSQAINPDAKLKVYKYCYSLSFNFTSIPENTISIMEFLWFHRIHEIIFWHIPSTAYKKIAPLPIFGIHKPCVGSINKERVASQEHEWGIMDILVHRPSVKAVFVGHNHGLDWCCPYKNLWLCFARHTGYGGYGDWPRGARIIQMTEQPFTLKSWIRMEDGSEHSEVILSSESTCSC